MKPTSTASMALLERSSSHTWVPMYAFVLPVPPHDLNQALNAQEYFPAVNDWIAATLGSQIVHGGVQVVRSRWPVHVQEIYRVNKPI